MTNIGALDDDFTSLDPVVWYYNGNPPVFVTGGMEISVADSSGLLDANASYTFAVGTSIRVRMWSVTGTYPTLFQLGVNGDGDLVYVGVNGGFIRASGEDIPPPFAPEYPEYFKVERTTADTWTSYTSTDGVTWTVRGTVSQGDQGNCDVAIEFWAGTIRVGSLVGTDGSLAVLRTVGGTFASPGGAHVHLKQQDGTWPTVEDIT